MSIYTQIQKNIVSYYTMLKEQSSTKYVKETLLGVAILSSLFLGYFLHSYYVKQREQKAFGALVEVVESFEKSQYEMFSSDKNKGPEKVDEIWSDTQVLTNALYEENKGSYLAPYFLMYKSQIALERGGNLEEALKILEQALQQISKSTEMYSLFNLKRIKMSLDSQDKKIKQAALKDLQELCKDNKGYSFEEGSFLLGSYYLYQGDIQKARETWENMLKFVDKKLLIQSPWVKQVEEKLDSIRLS